VTAPAACWWCGHDRDAHPNNGACTATGCGCVVWIEPEPKPEPQRFPIQNGLTVSWAGAEEAYRGYVRLYGDSQSLERIAERGGFGLSEFVGLVFAARAQDIGTAYDIVRGRPSDAPRDGRRSGRS
jgi:hypothetical protein